MEEWYGTPTRKQTLICSKESNDKQQDSLQETTYMSREEGSVSNLLVKLELQEFKERRTSKKLIFVYKVVEGLVPAIEPDDYLKKSTTQEIYHC